MYFADAVVVPVPWKKARADPPMGAIMSLRMANDGQEPITIDEVSTETTTEDGLEANVLGHSDCHDGCVGTGLTKPGTIRLATRSLSDGRSFTVFPISAAKTQISVVFELFVADAAIARRDHCLELEGVTVRLSDGSSHVVRSGGDGSIAAIEPQDTKGTSCSEQLHVDD